MRVRHTIGRALVVVATVAGVVPSGPPATAGQLVYARFEGLVNPDGRSGEAGDDVTSVEDRAVGWCREVADDSADERQCHIRWDTPIHVCNLDPRIAGATAHFTTSHGQQFDVPLIAANAAGQGIMDGYHGNSLHVHIDASDACAAYEAVASLDGVVKTEQRAATAPLAKFTGYVNVVVPAVP